MPGHALTLLTDIGLGIIFAAGAAHGARLLKQPLLLGYVAGGVLLGTQLGFGLVHDEASIELISEIGLILLLFIIGLEINLRELARMGRAMFVLGGVQFVACVLLGLAAFLPLSRAAAGRFDLLYLAVALALSSTLIVVKMLHDKFELHTVAGRLTVGVLVLQDVWAIAFMAVQPNLLDPRLTGILGSLGAGVLLLAAAFLVSRYVLGRLFHAACRSPELVLLTALAWCFSVCGLAEHAGLSKEMGALIAGLSIAAFPYGADVIAKLAGVRDFFVTLFFVALGLKVPAPTWGMTGTALLIAAFVLVSRLVTIAPVAHLLRLGLRNGLVTAFNLAQVSEFSLVIVALGAGYGHVSPDLAATVLTAMLLTSLLAPYLITWNDTLARGVRRNLLRLGVRLHGATAAGTDDSDGETKNELVLLGCFRTGEAFLDVLAERAPHLRERVLVVDFNAAHGQALAARGFRWAYGDVAHPETLQHLGIAGAAWIICPISDTFLKGTTNRRLLAHLRRLAPGARYLLSAESMAEADILRQEGAHQVIVAGRLTGSSIFAQVTAGGEA